MLQIEQQRGEMLVAFLNVKGKLKQKSGQRLTPGLQWAQPLTTVAELLKALRKLESLLWKEPPSADQLKNPVEWKRELDREKLEMSINQMLENYRFRPVVGADYRFHVYWLIANKPKISQAQMKSFREAGEGIGAMPIDATAAIQIMLEMATAGTLGRIRECRCGKWFFATTNKKVVCGDACRFQKYVEGKGKEEFKNERKEYMSTYRRNPKAKPRLKARRKKQSKKEK